MQLPETKPALEFIDGEIIQKPVPEGKHSRLQLRICNAINDAAEAQKIAYAFPELRCSFGSRSVVPDIAVFSWGRIPFAADGEAPNDSSIHPDWTIEIFSPEQNPTKVIGNILYCLQSGSQLGWFIDPGARSVLAFRPSQQPELLQKKDFLLVLPEIPLTLTVEQMFDWLKMA